MQSTVGFINSTLHLANNPSPALREYGYSKILRLQEPLQVSQGSLLVDQDVAYYRNAFSSSHTKTMNSLLTLEVDNEES